jgi:hypothetical protein
MTSQVNIVRLLKGIERRTDKLSPYQGPTRAAMASAEVLMDALAEAGMARSDDFVECLATIIDTYSALPGLMGACIAAWELCTVVTVTASQDDSLLAEFMATADNCGMRFSARERLLSPRQCVRIRRINRASWAQQSVVSSKWNRESRDMRDGPRTRHRYED